jgi:GNAT superfamily N-acetyltransferase
MTDREATWRWRLGAPDDAAAIARLLRRVAARWLWPDQPAAAIPVILRNMTAPAVRKAMVEGRRYHTAWRNDHLVGVLAMRDDSHVFHLFIATRWQGRGVGRRLWQRAMADAVRRAGTRRFTVNSSRVAVPAYRRLGFVETSGEVASPLGVLSTPMVYELR